MAVLQHFSKRLRELRKERGLTQGALAKESKISRGSISYYENGERTPDIEVLDKISRYFGVHISYMMGYDNIKCADWEKMDREEERMKLVNEIAALCLDITDIEHERDSLYIRQQELKSERSKKIERLKELTRQGKTLEQLEEMEES